MRRVATAGLCMMLVAMMGAVPAIAEEPSTASAEATETTPVAIHEADDYTVFTDAVESVIEANGDLIHSAKLNISSRAAIADIQASAQTYDATQAPQVVAGTGTASTIAMAGDVIPYVTSWLSASAPEQGGGLWYGADSTTDGSWGYFIGHNPGSFSGMLSMGTGSAVTVTDSAGDARTYHVIKVFDVPNTTTWEQIEGDVTGYGESIILQTCIDNGSSYRIMVAD